MDKNVGTVPSSTAEYGLEQVTLNSVSQSGSTTDK